MNDLLAEEISRKLSVLIALSIRQLTGDTKFGKKERRNQGAGDLVHYLASLGLDAKDIAPIIGSPVGSVRTLLTPKRKK